MPDWDKLLGKKAEDAKPPPPFPVGTYTLEVLKHRFDESSQKKTPFVEFTFSIADVGEDVDKEELAELKDWKKRQPYDRFYLTDNADFRLADFLQAAGVPIGGGRTFKECIPDTKGCLVKGYMVQEPIEGTDRMRSIIQRYAPVED